MKGKKRKVSIKNIILKSITAFALFFGICLCCGVEPQTDAETILVLVSLIGCWGWIFILLIILLVFYLIGEFG